MGKNLIWNWGGAGIKRCVSLKTGRGKKGRGEVSEKKVKENVGRRLKLRRTKRILVRETAAGWRRWSKRGAKSNNTLWVGKRGQGGNKGGQRVEVVPQSISQERGKKEGDRKSGK